jgi:hypothetical protein
MKINPLWILVVLYALTNNSALCYIYRLRVVEKPAQGNCHKQIIVLLSDYHDKKHPANKQQRAQLETFLSTYIPGKVKLIVEDLSSANNDGRMICCNYGINCVDGMLGQLAHKVRQMGVNVDNVEYRYCRVAAIGPLINNIGADPHSFRSSTSITLAALHKEIINEIEKIKKYDDGKKLNRFYKRALAAVGSTLSQLCICKAERTKSVACYCAHIQSKHYREELEKICIFDSSLIDSNIMHSIACSNEQIIFIVAGGSHIEQVDAWLESIGSQELLLITSRQSEPIDISVLQKFIPQ